MTARGLKARFAHCVADAVPSGAAISVSVPYDSNSA